MKQAQYTTFTLMMLWKAAMTFAAFFVVFLIVSQGTNLHQSSRSIDAQIASQMMLYSPILMQTDPITHRVYPGRINETAFDDLHREKTMQTLDSYFSTAPGVNYMGMSIAYESTTGKHELFLRKNFYDTAMTYIQGNFVGGKGGHGKFTYVYPLQFGGLLSVTVVVPNG